MKKRVFRPTEGVDITMLGSQTNFESTIWLSKKCLAPQKGYKSGFGGLGFCLQSNSWLTNKCSCPEGWKWKYWALVILHFVSVLTKQALGTTEGTIIKCLDQGNLSIVVLINKHVVEHTEGAQLSSLPFDSLMLTASWPSDYLMLTLCWPHVYLMFTLCVPYVDPHVDILFNLSGI